MAAIRKRSLKVFTFIVLLVFLTSFFLNYAHTTTAYTWFPNFSEHFKRFLMHPKRPCSCSQCISETGFVPWFDERFNHTIQPLLNAQNALLENDTYKWWMSSGHDSRANYIVRRLENWRGNKKDELTPYWPRKDEKKSQVFFWTFIFRYGYHSTLVRQSVSKGFYTPGTGDTKKGKTNLQPSLRTKKTFKGEKWRKRNPVSKPMNVSKNKASKQASLMKLQRERLPSRLNDTLKELFRIVRSDVDPFLGKGPLVCRRCAVVGNSGNLKQSQYGRDIDSHDFVLRMNRAPTAGFEVDVGRKTTHHLVYPESFRELAENVTMILIPFKTLDLQWVISAMTKGTINFTYVPVPRKIHVKREKILIYHPAFMKYVFNSWLQNHGRYPSTGILSVILSLHICDEVDLYGFGADSKGNWHHYWENNPSAGAFRKTGVHDGDFESNVTTTLASLNKIRIFKGR